VEEGRWLIGFEKVRLGTEERGGGRGGEEGEEEEEDEREDIQ